MLAWVVGAVLVVVGVVESLPHKHHDHKHGGDSGSGDGLGDNLSELIIRVMEICVSKLDEPNCESRASHCLKWMGVSPDNAEPKDITALCGDLTDLKNGEECWNMAAECSKLIIPAGENPEAEPESPFGDLCASKNIPNCEGRMLQCAEILYPGSETEPVPPNADALCSAGDSACQTQVQDCLQLYTDDIVHRTCQTMPSPSVCQAHAAECQKNGMLPPGQTPPEVLVSTLCEGKGAACFVEMSKLMLECANLLGANESVPPSPFAEVCATKPEVPNCEGRMSECTDLLYKDFTNPTPPDVEELCGADSKCRGKVMECLELMTSPAPGMGPGGPGGPNGGPGGPFPPSPFAEVCATKPEVPNCEGRMRECTDLLYKDITNPTPPDVDKLCGADNKCRGMVMECLGLMMSPAPGGPNGGPGGPFPPSPFAEVCATKPEVPNCEGRMRECSDLLYKDITNPTPPDVDELCGADSKCRGMVMECLGLMMSPAPGMGPGGPNEGPGGPFPPSPFAEVCATKPEVPNCEGRMRECSDLLYKDITNPTPPDVDELCGADNECRGKMMECLGLMMSPAPEPATSGLAALGPCGPGGDQEDCMAEVVRCQRILPSSLQAQHVMQHCDGDQECFIEMQTCIQTVNMMSGEGASKPEPVSESEPEPEYKSEPQTGSDTSEPKPEPEPESESESESKPKQK